MHFSWHIRQRWHAPDIGIAGYLFRCIKSKVSPFSKHRRCILKRIYGKGSIDFRTKRVQTKFKRGNYTKISTASTNRPKEVFVFILAGSDNSAISSYNLNREQIVA